MSAMTPPTAQSTAIDYSQFHSESEDYDTFAASRTGSAILIGAAALTIPVALLTVAAAPFIAAVRAVSASRNKNKD